jgi:hypothetical protein
LDASSLRPVWFYSDAAVEAKVWCYIATGNSVPRSFTTGGPSSSECGWMYGTFDHPALDCADFRRYSEVDSPGDIANTSWSFDKLTDAGCRSGQYPTFECAWPP